MRLAVIAVIWIAVVTLISFLPHHGKQELHTKGRLHPWGHLLAFGGIGFTLVRSARSLEMRIFLLLLSGAFALTLEFAQQMRYGMGMEWRDVGVDCLGVVLGGAVAILADHTPGRDAAEKS